MSSLGSKRSRGVDVRGEVAITPPDLSNPTWGARGMIMMESHGQWYLAIEGRSREKTKRNDSQKKRDGRIL